MRTVTFGTQSSDMTASVLLPSSACPFTSDRRYAGKGVALQKYAQTHTGVKLRVSVDVEGGALLSSGQSQHIKRRGSVLSPCLCGSVQLEW